MVLDGTGITNFTAPSPLNLGNDQDGDTTGVTAIEVLTLNKGDIISPIVAGSITGTNASDFTAALVSGAPAGEQDVLVTFKASIVGSETANLAIKDNDGNTHTVVLDGTGITNFTAPSPLNLGNDQDGDTTGVTALEVLTLNKGDIISPIVAGSITGTNASDFTAALVSGAPAGEQDVLVTFKASTVGSETANLAIRDNDGNTHTVVLDGTGITNFTAPSPLNLGNDQDGDTTGVTAIEVLTLNKGDIISPIVAGSITGTNASDFTAALVSGAPAGEQDVLVTFKASLVGSETANLAIMDNDGNTHNVILEGTGVGPTVSFNPNPLSFAPENVGSTESLLETISNTGSASLLISSISFEGPNAGDFNDPGFGPITIEAGGAVTYHISFTASVVGVESGTLLIDNNPELALNLTGTGITNFTAPSPLNLGNDQVGASVTATEVLTLNTGDVISPIVAGDITGTNASDFTAAARLRSSCR